MERTHSIVLTGGPCAGKTTIIKEIRNHLESNSKNKVISPPEVATYLFSSGIGLDTLSCLEFQILVFKTILDNEFRFASLAESLINKFENVYLIWDRGLLDGKAYCDLETWNKVLNYFSLEEKDILIRYSSVLHLESVAVRHKDRYGNHNNEHRQEVSPEDAADSCHRTFQAWSEHPNLMYVPAFSNFSDKIQYVLRKI